MIRKEVKKIKQHFNKGNGKGKGIVATLEEEILKTRTINHATFFYLDEECKDDVKQRKLIEEKLITDFVSERELFNKKQAKGKHLL